MSKKIKRLLALVMAFVVIFSNVVFASETNYIYVPEIDIDDTVKDSNLFYLASSNIEMDEGSNGHYLVRIGRGGDISQEASVVVKMSDYTAKYGKDYKVYLYDGGLFNGADKDSDALSVMEMIEGQDHTEFDINDNEELEKAIEDGVISGGALAVDIAKGINQVVADNKAAKGEDNSDYVEAANNVKLIEADEFNNSITAETETTTENTDTSNSDDINTLAGAKKAFTGVESDRVKPKASTNMIDQFEQLQAYQDVADTISDAMTGATLKVDFAEGETDKYIEIVPINNTDSDSTRIFNITIGDPEGEYTVSTYSSAMAKIVDDEEVVKAKMSLEDAKVTYTGEQPHASVTIKRDGGINDIVSVMLKTKSGTAMSGRDFSPVSAEAVFPFGVTERTIDIPIDTSSITDEAYFSVYIDTPVSCEIGENSEINVTIAPSSNTEDDNISTMSAEDSNDGIQLQLNENTYKQNQRIYFPRVYTGNSATRRIDKSSGFKDNCQQEGDYGWYIRPTDDEHWAIAAFGVNNEALTNRYDVNGLEFDYRAKYAAYPRDGIAHVGFKEVENNTSGTTNYNNKWYFTGRGTSNNWENGKKIYTNAGNIFGVQVQAEDEDGSGRDIQAHFRDLYPIKRQFKINLAAADKMKLRTVSGDKITFTEVQPSAAINNKMSKILGIDAGDTDTLAYRTSGEKITVSVGNNNYFTFKGLYAVNSSNPKDMIKIADANGNNSCTFTLDNDLLTKLIHRDNQDKWDFVTLSDRNDGGKYGNITIKPVFEYKDRKVYVEKNTQFDNKLSIDTYNSLGLLAVNGVDYILNESMSNIEVKPYDGFSDTFHYGDEFIINTKASYPDIAKAAGVGYRTGINLDTMNSIRTDKRTADGCYKFTRENSGDVLKNNVISLYPIYTEKENGLTLLVRKSDIDNGIIDTSTGILSKFVDNSVNKLIETRRSDGKDVEYYRFVVSKDVKTDTYYDYFARAKDGYAIKWVDDTTKKVYSGNHMIYKPAGISQYDNVLVVSAENKDVVNVRFKGSVNYKAYDISTGMSSDATMPLENAAVTMGGIGATTNDKGEFETTEVGKYIRGTHVIKRVSVDNSFNYVDYTVNTTNKKLVTPNEESFSDIEIKSVQETKTVQTGTRKVKNLVFSIFHGFSGDQVNGDRNAPYTESETIGRTTYYYNTTDEPVYETTVVAKPVTETVKKTDTVYIINTGSYTAEINNDGVGISEVNVYEGDSTFAQPGTIDINDSEYVFRANVRESSDEHIKSLKFIIVESSTKKIKYEIPATYEESSKQWVAREKMDTSMNGSYTSGDTLYAVYSTDKNVSGLDGALKTYLPVYTGYDFVQGDSAYDSYEPQNFDLPVNGSFGSLPVLDKLTTGFSFPYVSIALEKLETGEYRVKIGVDVTEIVDKAADTSITGSGKSDDGTKYEKIDWKHPIDSLKENAKTAYKKIFKGGLDSTSLFKDSNGNPTKMNFGPAQFKVSVTVGGYIDFGRVEVTRNGQKTTEYILSGGGGYIGISVSYRQALYFLISAVPVYIGGRASGDIVGNMGATRKSNAVVALSDMKDKQLEIDDALEFNGNLKAGVSVGLYAGVGLYGVLGARVEGAADFGFVWEPLAKQKYAMNDEVDEIVDNDYSNAKIHEVGFTVAFSLGGKIDLLLFTVPLMYKFDPINFGFNKDMKNAHVRKTSANSTIDVNGSTVSTDSTGHIADGWYYIKNVYNEKYLQEKDGKFNFVLKSAQENPAMRFYVSTEKNMVTIKPQDGYGDTLSKYLMLDKDNNDILNLSDSLSNDKLNAYHKFYLREPNIGDFNIISAGDGGNKCLTINDKNEAIFDTDNIHGKLWRFEPVDEPITNGTYTIKINKLNKYLTDKDGKAQLAEQTNDNSQKWYVSVSGDYITLRNLATKNYLYVDSNSGNNGIGISVKAKDEENSDAILFDTTKLIDGSYNITTKYSVGRKYLTVYNSGTDVVSNDYNDTYDQAWTFTEAATVVNGGNTTNNTNTQMLSDEGVSLFTAKNDVDDITPITVNDDNDYDDKVTLRKRTTGDSQWVANNNNGISLYSGFKPTSETTLVKNSYERPDSKVVDLGNGNYMVVFIDTDSSRGELERNVMKFAIYRDGVWSEPKVVQNDGTADFQPSVADAGENVAISWISSDPNVEKTGDPSQYLTTMEVYTTLVNKNTGEVGEITRLTKDTYYDYSPTVVYDSVTGDMAVYYVKSTVGKSFLESANSFTNDCIMTYMLYDNNMGKWLTDYYYPEEVSDEDTAKELIEKWGGQRFLSSPIDDLNMKDPLIVDFTAISYNGLAVYGYTIDKDNDSSTNTDRDLFIQVYDFTTHKNHPPIRITNDGEESSEYSREIADSMPQFVRAGGTDGNTYLYWFRDDKKLSYINVSELAHNGLNDDGTVSNPDLIAPKDVYINLPPEISGGSIDAYATMSYYKVCVDKDDNIYVIWVDLDNDTNKQEIFASAVITDKETGETSYSDAYQLTHSDKNNDEPALVVDDDGNMIVISTRYNSTRTDDPLNPLEITDTELVATLFAPYGELHAEDINISDNTPNKGDVVNVNAKLYNRGLTVAKGYTVELCEMKNDEKIRTLDTIHSTDYVNAGDYAELNYDWVVSDNIDGVKLGIIVTEGNMSNSSTAQSEELRETPDITLSGIGISQKEDGFYLHAVATNNGNKSTSESDNINVVYYPDKAPANMLGISDEHFAKTQVGVIAPNENKEIDIKIDNVKGEYFNAYGYLPVLVAVTNDKDTVISNSETSYMIMENPIDVKVNDTTQIVINEGEAVDLSMTYGPSERYGDVTPSYHTEDSNTAVVVNNQLVGVSAGSTTLIANAQPYNSSAKIEVVVNAVESTTETTTEAPTETTTTARRTGGGSSGGKSSVTTETTTDITTETTTETTTEAITEVTTENSANDQVGNDKFVDVSNHWAKDIINKIADKNIINGYNDNTFKPNNSITRAEFLTILYNSGLADTNVSDNDIKFADVTGDEWYVDYIKWGAENNLIVGYDDNTFRGNNLISRQEMSVVISKFIKLANIELDNGEAVKFADEDAIAPWAKEYVDNISAYGIVKGDNNNCYMPNKDLTRAETTVIIDKLMQ